MNRADLEELLARCEAATRPDREIDGAIALFVGWTFQKMKGDSKPYWRAPGETQYYMRSDAPRYTSSLDAIVRLIEQQGYQGPECPDRTQFGCRSERQGQSRNKGNGRSPQGADECR